MKKLLKQAIITTIVGMEMLFAIALWLVLD